MNFFLSFFLLIDLLILSFQKEKNTGIINFKQLILEEQTNMRFGN